MTYSTGIHAAHIMARLHLAGRKYTTRNVSHHLANFSHRINYKFTIALLVLELEFCHIWFMCFENSVAPIRQARLHNWGSNAFCKPRPVHVIETPFWASFTWWKETLAYQTMVFCYLLTMFFCIKSSNVWPNYMQAFRRSSCFLLISSTTAGSTLST